MFYVLNFKNHSFKSCDDEAAVIAAVNILLVDGEADSEDEIEIINGFTEYTRFSVEEFREEFC